jgi:N-acetylglucosamine-6-phosphate deacetylase
MRLRAHDYATGEEIDIVYEDGRVRRCEKPGPEPTDLQAQWIAPAWFDIQINGAGGVNFTSDTLAAAQIANVADVCLERGVGGFCPTVITSSFPTLQHALRTLLSARNQQRRLAEMIPCFHLEGPYISPEDGPRGAHPLAHVRPPDLNEFCRLQDAAEGLIRLVTLAPELRGAIAFVEKLTSMGIVIAIGHTAATPLVLRDAVAAGARLSTHLGNGCHAMLPRHDNYLWEQMGDDRLWASLICDGQHLPPALMRCLIRAKTPARTILTCDASPLAGLRPGVYREWGQELEVVPEGKVIVRGTGFLAGSWNFTDTCIANAMRFAGVTLCEAVDMASVRPRQLLGLPVPTLAPGQAGPFVLFDQQGDGGIHTEAVVD